MKENPLVHHADGSTRFFKCDFSGGCGEHTLTAHVVNNKVHLYCTVCGYSSCEDAPYGLTNPTGSASFIGGMSGMGQ